MAENEISVSETRHRFSNVSEEPCIELTPIEGFKNKPLVPIEEATKPLLDIVPRLEKYVYVAKNRAKNPKDDLSVDESAAIGLYTMEWEPYTDSLYYILNKTLRNEERTKLKPWFSYLKLILTGLSRLKSTSTVVFRGVKHFIESEHEKYKENTTVFWWGFSSCSREREISEDDHFIGEAGKTTRTLFIINCLNGKDISNHSYYKEKESEVLLLPATTVQVVEYERTENGLHTIYLQEVESPYPYLENVSTESEIRRLKNGTGHKNHWKTMKESIMAHKHTINPKLQESVSRQAYGRDAYLGAKRLSDFEVEFIVKELMGDKACPRLFLRESGISPAGARIIAEALQSNLTLQMLFMSENKVGDEGVKHLAAALADDNTSLKELNLARNGITDEGVVHIANMLKSNKTIIRLWLGENEITDKGLSFLCDVLTTANQTLQVLSLEWNRFRNDSSATKLADLLKNNRSLTQLNISSCKLPTAGTKQLKFVAKSRPNFELFIN